MATSPVKPSTSSSIAQPSYKKLPFDEYVASDHLLSSLPKSPSALLGSSADPVSPSSWSPRGRPPSTASSLKLNILQLQAAAAKSLASKGTAAMASQSEPAAERSSQDQRTAYDNSDDAESLSEHSDDGREQAATNPASGDRPRVRAEGPGGADIKRGARIACLECRSAKIRCSAPNDGQVPCKRCARHDKECVFEKHRRGRKPGRGNLPKHAPFPPHSRPSSLSNHLQGTPGEQSYPGGHHSHHGSGHWSPPLPTSQSMPHLPSPSGYHGIPSSTPQGLHGSSDYFSRPLAPGEPPSRTPKNAAGSHPPLRNPSSSDPADLRQMNSAHPGSLPHFPRGPDFGSGAQVSRSALRSPYDGAGPLSSHGGLPQAHASPFLTGSSSRQHGFFSPPLPRAEAGSPQGHSSFTPLPPGKDELYSARWGPTFGSSYSRQSVQPRAPSESPRLASLEQSSSNQTQSQTQLEQLAQGISPPLPSSSGRLAADSGVSYASHARHTDSSGQTGPTKAPSATVRSQQQPQRSPSSEDGEEDELVDEDDVGGGHQDAVNALSRPLQLLAYASTAAARRQLHGGYRDPRSVAAAATLGLISAPNSVSKTQRVASPNLLASLKARGGQEPATLENGNWEYKSGKVRAVKNPNASQSPASLSKDSDDTGADQLISVANQAVEQDVLTDSGPHLGKRRRSDDEPLPLSRRQSQVRESKVAKPSASPAIADKLSEEDQRKAVDQSAAEAGRPAEQGASASTADAVEVAAGASRKGYFRFSLYSSKLDVDDKDDPIHASVATLKEMEDLFDVFFNQLNPINVIFDPFLHSISYVRARSKFLLTVIASHAARMTPGARNAELAEKLDHHWRAVLLPNILIGGYKSVEISQAFLLASQFHRPTHIIVEDRAWQYLGFAIRTATEIGVNIALAPKARDQEDEQIARRLRNRERLWMSLVIAEGILSTQFGRPCTLKVQDAITQSPYWNREDYALPEDAALVCQIELRKIVERSSQLFEQSAPSDHAEHARTESSALGDPQDRTQSSALVSAYSTAWQELEKWKKIWSPSEGVDYTGIGGSMATSAFLVRWSPYSRLIYYYWRCHLNSILLQAVGGREDVASPVAFDSLLCAKQLLDTLLDDKQIGGAGLALAPNAVVVMATYAAVSALRLAKLDHSRHALVNSREFFERVSKLADALQVAGQSPPHRDGAAGPYGLYLQSVLALFDNDSKSSSSVASEAHRLGQNPAGLSDVTGAAQANEKHATVSAASGTATKAPEASKESEDYHLTKSQTHDIAPAATAKIDGKTAQEATADALAATTDAILRQTASNVNAAVAAAQGMPSTSSLDSLSVPATAGTGSLPDNASSLVGDADVAAISGVYASDSEVWEYLSNDPAATSLWPSNSAPWSGL
ncbi:unnamed protein product [Sympodiomycopsis kandeliae]